MKVSFVIPFLSLPEGRRLVVRGFLVFCRLFVSVILCGRRGLVIIPTIHFIHISPHTCFQAP